MVIKMDKVSEFKEFVKENPNLIKYVKNNQMTWQKFYEIYDIYGPNDNVWNDYKEEKNSLNDIISWIKGIDLDVIEENIGNIKRVISVLQDLGDKNDMNQYKPRPIYKHFED